MERDVVYGETRTVTKIQAREGVEDLRSVYTPFVQSGEAFSTIIDRCDNSSPSPSPFFMQTEEKGAPGSISRKCYHAVDVECRFFDGYMESRIRLSKEVDYLA